MANGIPTIRGNNINIRGVEESDLDIIMEWRNRPEVMKCFFNRNKLTAEGQRIWYANYLNNANDHMFMIETKDNVSIGTMALYNIDFSSKKAEYGRALIAAEGYQGKGYAREALLLILEYAFTTLDLNRIYLEVFSDNISAIKLYEVCGFKIEGLLKEHFYNGTHYSDVLMMAILRSAY